MLDEEIVIIGDVDYSFPTEYLNLVSQLNQILEGINNSRPHTPL